MNKSNDIGQPIADDEKYEGFVVDLMEEIAKHLGIRYRFHLVADNEYGVDAYNNGTFNGMVGEVVNKVSSE